ncbi:cytochrome P450 [Spongiibacter nanhainus]|uniref:Cytochrome P450 n=1 Tax=Spongiibacter nanhainus TaxID=2794344 RepID=A0A7T4QZZ7_9GAMM|nr:cytochrome P450 [Spongiibacter nanhainus]QQD17764.1 cytochrome P450 [Spongiibacter nanhainus]
MTTSTVTNQAKPAAVSGGGAEPPRASGGLPVLGQMLNFVRNPYQFVKGLADRHGEIVSFKLLGQRIVLLTGEEASTLFYRSSDEQLDQSAAYKLMTPIFGEGLVFDAPNDRKNEQLKSLMPSLRMEAMRDHSHKIVKEVEESIADWGDSGEIDLVDFMKRLTINTASHCLLGREFRYELSEEFAEIYHDLEQGVHPLAYHFPGLPLPRFRRRDRARARLQTLVGGIVERRKAQTDKPTDMFQSLIDMRYEDGSALDDNEITGLLVGAIFAGHHTSSGTAAWVLLELLRHPDYLRRVNRELDTLLGAEGAVSFQSLREVPTLENALKEVLRLHPPLIILMRKVSEPLTFKHYRIAEGDMVWTSPPVTHRIASLFANPFVFDPDRFSKERGEDRRLMAYQPFGGGKHKCSGNAFAMFQIKAIFAILLRRYDFELVDAPDSYVDNYAEMIVQPMTPCRVRYRRRDPASFSSRLGSSAETGAETDTLARCPAHSQRAEPQSEQLVEQSLLVEVDRQLCQGHAMCTGEAPEVFKVNDDGVLTIVDNTVSEARRKRIEAAVAHCPNQALRIVKAAH